MLIFKVNQDSLDDVILLTSQGVSFTETQEGLFVRRGVSALCLLVSLCTVFKVDQVSPLNLWGTRLGVRHHTLVRAIIPFEFWHCILLPRLEVNAHFRFCQSMIST